MRYSLNAYTFSTGPARFWWGAESLSWQWQW